MPTAFELRSKLFDLINEFKSLQLQVRNDEAYSQIDQAACQLATVYESLGDVFIDAARAHPSRPQPERADR